MYRKRLMQLAAAVVLLVGVAYTVFAPAKPLVLTGIVTTNDVIVSPQVGGLLSKLLVEEGDSVSTGQLLAEISAGELVADQAYYAHSAEGMATEVRETESAVRYQEQQMTQQVRQAEATVASAEAQRAQAAADLANAQANYDRYAALLKSGAISQQNVDQQHTELLVARAKSEAATQAFPTWMRVSSRIDPFSYAVHALKSLLLENTGFGAIGYDLLYLALFSRIAMTLATKLFRRTL